MGFVSMPGSQNCIQRTQEVLIDGGDKYATGVNTRILLAGIISQVVTIVTVCFKSNRGDPMVKSNYTFEKRQKELAKKKEEKRLKKLAASTGNDRSQSDDDTPNVGEHV